MRGGRVRVRGRDVGCARRASVLKRAGNQYKLHTASGGCPGEVSERRIVSIRTRRAGPREVRDVPP